MENNLNIMFSFLFNIELANGDFNYVAGGVYSVFFMLIVCALYEYFINKNIGGM